MVKKNKDSLLKKNEKIKPKKRGLDKINLLIILIFGLTFSIALYYETGDSEEAELVIREIFVGYEEIFNRTTGKMENVSLYISKPIWVYNNSDNGIYIELDENAHCKLDSPTADRECSFDARVIYTGEDETKTIEEVSPEAYFLLGKEKNIDVLYNGQSINGINKNTRIRRGDYNFTIKFDYPQNSYEKIDISLFGVLIDPTVSGCTEITGSGVYTMNQSIINSPTSNCININSDDVIFDCDGYIIDGDTTTFPAVKSSNKNNITIKNCIVKDWSFYGFEIDNIGDSLFENNNIYNIQMIAARFDTLNNSLITNSSFDSNMSAIYADDFKNSNITNINVTTALDGSTLGIDIRGFNTNNLLIQDGYIYNYWRGISINSDNTTIKNLIVDGSSSSGIYSIGTNYNIINNTIKNGNIGMELQSSNANNNVTLNNIINNTNAIKFRTTSYPINIYNNLINSSNYTIDLQGKLVSFNTTNQTGTRIYSDGTQIGGNYWTNSTGGYSDICTDTDEDGFCDSPLNLTNMQPCTAGTDCDENATDYLPLSDEYADGDSCSPSSPLTSNYTFYCADNCVLSSNLDAGGFNILFDGVGYFHLNANITNIGGLDLGSSSEICQIILSDNSNLYI